MKFSEGWRKDDILSPSELPTPPPRVFLPYEYTSDNDVSDDSLAIVTDKKEAGTC